VHDDDGTSPLHDRFIVHVDNGTVLHCATVLLATGLIDIEPEVLDLKRAEYSGLLRHCGICDAFEVSGQRIGVLGNAKHGLQTAEFLRTYSSDVTYIWLEQTDTSPNRLSPMQDTEEGSKAPCSCCKETSCVRQGDGMQGQGGAGSKVKPPTSSSCGVKIVPATVQQLILHTQPIGADWHGGCTSPPTCGNSSRACVHLSDGSDLRFDTIYSALGEKPRSAVAVEMGVITSDVGCILPQDTDMATNVEGVYCAGDVCGKLNQMVTAQSDATQAAVSIHRYLSRKGVCNYMKPDKGKDGGTTKQ
jgi:thioredoxin reductase (NADPH)